MAEEYLPSLFLVVAVKSDRTTPCSTTPSEAKVMSISPPMAVSKEEQEEVETFSSPVEVSAGDLQVFRSHDLIPSSRGDWMVAEDEAGWCLDAEQVAVEVVLVLCSPESPTLIT